MRLKQGASWGWPPSEGWPFPLALSQRMCHQGKSTWFKAAGKRSSGNLSEEGAYTFLFFLFLCTMATPPFTPEQLEWLQERFPYHGDPHVILGLPPVFLVGSPHHAIPPAATSLTATAMTVSAATPLDHQVLTYHCLLIEYIGKVLGSRK